MTASPGQPLPLTGLLFTGLMVVAGAVLAFDASARGGHCGFIHNWRLESWAELRVLALLRQRGL